VLLGLFAGLAVLFSALGTYAVMAYSVALRTRELGIRQAFGAGPRDVFNLVMGQGIRQTCLGVLIGLALAAALSRLIAGFLFQVRALDVQVYAAVMACVVIVALAACLAPLQRALRVEPAKALRDE
jgi:ABC-type antimicrobial peptide transport system permease subunit